MKLLKLRVKNYKSIIDSGECSLEKGVTIFAGKNEAGKTALLEALEDFNLNSKIKIAAVPLFRKNKQPQITLTFAASASELNNALRDFGLPQFTTETEIILTKIYPGNTYVVPDETFIKLGIKNTTLTAEDEKVLNEKYKLIKAELEPFYPAIHQLLPELNLENPEITKANFQQFISAPKIEITDEDSKLTINSMSQDFVDVLSIPTSDRIREKITDAFTRIIPTFILFNSFEDVFPSTITIEEAANSPLMKDLDLISNLNLDILKNGNPSEKMEHKLTLNQRMREEYQKYWTQDVTNLQVDYDSGKLNFFIVEDGKYYPPVVRSKGKQWHLAFYIRVSARSAEDVTNIILIDEPGLFLHATAQKDILRKLEDSAKRSQVIFTTHSPYLIEQDNFIRIRLVQRGVIPKIIEQSSLEGKFNDNKNTYTKLIEFYEVKNHKDGGNYFKLRDKELNEDEENAIRNILIQLEYNIGTTIEDKLHKVSDKETLTPILTAIGLELTDGINSTEKVRNVVCEGLSDVFYLQAFKRLINNADNNFIFGGGSGNMPIVGTILSGWGCKILYLYDNDKGKKDGEKNLKKNWLITTGQILSVVEKIGGSVEDVFEQVDFKKFVLEDEKTLIKKTNSEYMKVEGKDKVMHAKNFYRLCEANKVVMSATTMKRIKVIFDEFSKRFKEEF
ncbi:MAG: AAA family ATPase [Patescibacteria group bacterium]|jgi:predicted ATP-dependent endonuclease of OLD family